MLNTPRTLLNDALARGRRYTTRERLTILCLFLQRGGCEMAGRKVAGRKCWKWQRCEMAGSAAVSNIMTSHIAHHYRNITNYNSGHCRQNQHHLRPPPIVSYSLLSTAVAAAAFSSYRYRSLTYIVGVVNERPSKAHTKKLCG